MPARTSPRVTLTEARMRAWSETQAEGESRLYDDAVRQLCARRRANGRPRWYLTVRANGRLRQVPLGDLGTWPEVTVAQARDLARKALADLAGGGDPVEERAERRERAIQDRRGRAPLADALAIHLAEVKRRGRRDGHLGEIKRIIGEAIKAGVSDLADPGILATARKWLDSLDLSPVTVNRYRVHLLAVGKTALANFPPEVLPRDPFLGLRGQGAPLPEPAYFTPAEAVLLVSDRALELEGGHLWAFLLYSGCRFREATWARWNRVNLDRATFDVVPPNKLERAAGYAVKRDKPRTVHLPGELVTLLRSWRPADVREGAFIFDHAWRTDAPAWRTIAFRAHLDSLGIPVDGRKPHSLRHTRQTLGLACGEDSLRLRLCMGHAGDEMSAHYGRMSMRWRGLLSGWGGELRLRDPVEVARLTGTADAPAAEGAT